MNRFYFLPVVLTLVLVFASCGAQKPTDRYTDYRTGQTFADRTELLENTKRTYPSEYEVMFEIAKEYPGIYDVYAKAHEDGLINQNNKISYFDENGNEISEVKFHETLTEAGLNSDIEYVVPTYFNYLTQKEYRKAFELVYIKSLFAKSFSSDPDNFKQMQVNIESSSKPIEAKVVDARIVETSSKPMVRVFFKVLGFFQNNKEQDQQTNHNATQLEPPTSIKPPTSPEEARRLAEKMGDANLYEKAGSWEYKYSGITSFLLGFSENKWLIYEQP